MIRERLCDRRTSLNVTVATRQGLFDATGSFYPDGRLAEVFLSARKNIGGDLDLAARAHATTASLALQHGTPVEILLGAQPEGHEGAADGVLALAVSALTGAIRDMLAAVHAGRGAE